MKPYKHFGVMLDCSRNAVMKVESVKRMVDCLQKMGYNALELYCEDTYEVGEEPYFGYLRGRYTGEEIREIDGYAKAHGIELIPCIQTLAHFTVPSRHDVYCNIFDLQDILLIDEPQTYEFIDRLFKTTAENFTSRNINIGMDEAHMVGLGRYLQRHGYCDRFELLSRHLDKVAKIAKKYGFKAHMWSDMFFRLATGGEYYKPNAEIPESVKKKIPENVELTYWDYYNTDKAVYDGMFKSHLEFGCGVWFAGGAWCWQGFAPLTKFSLRSMKPAMQSAVEHNVENVLITAWGDDGKECSFYSLLHTLYTTRQYGDGNFDEEKIQKGFEELFGIKYADMMLLDLPNMYNENDELETTHNPCKAVLYSDPFMGMFDTAVAEVGKIPYKLYAEKLASAVERVGEYGYVFDSLSKLCSVMEIKYDLGVRTRQAYKANDKKGLEGLIAEYEELERRLGTFHQAFYTLWHKENKPQGWEIQDARLGGLIQRVATCKKRLRAYIIGEIEKIEELEEKILPYGDGKDLRYNSYARTISMSNF